MLDVSSILGPYQPVVCPNGQVQYNIPYIASAIVLCLFVYGFTLCLNNFIKAFHKR